MTTGLTKVLEHFRRVAPAAGGLGDGPLLARFVALRDEASFAALVQRHGPMVLGVCRRLLGNHHDAEDAFQATFLVLARKAAAVRHEAVAGWLYAVAYRTALEARSVLARRRAHERQVDPMPHPEVGPPEAQDWRPLLDRELSRLPEKYRAPLVLCELEGWPRREAARQLKLAEGTLSSRLARARALLARSLTRHGVSLSAAALTAILADGACAAVPLRLVGSTTRAALLVALGQMAGVSPSAAVLMKGVMKAMFLSKLKVAVGATLVLAALAAGGFASRGGAQAAPPEGNPPSGVEALRKENELLKLNLNVVLEKVRAQEAELRSLREQLVRHPDSKPKTVWHGLNVNVADIDAAGNLDIYIANIRPVPMQEVEQALKALHEARDPAAKRQAAEALEKASKRLREELKEPAKPAQ